MGAEIVKGASCAACESVTAYALKGVLPVLHPALNACNQTADMCGWLGVPTGERLRLFQSFDKVGMLSGPAPPCWQLSK